MKVYIKELTFKAIIGILDFERVKKQTIIVDIDFKYSFTKSSKEFIDYSLVASDVKKIMKKENFLLIEDAILELTQQLILKYKIKKLNLKITKPDILKDCTVSVSS